MMKNETNPSKLVAENGRYVEAIAKQYLNRGLTLEQLIEEGNKGLVAAAERYDASKGYAFINYAVWWVRQSMLQALIDIERGEPSPDDNQLSARERGILCDIADGESLEQIAEERRLTVERVRQISEKAQQKINRF